ncbi:uncharacterized protein spmap2l isoform X2 [Oreochromis niloticus]|uniref:uncharacterized protein spmap2l isoform X2 n=1 Tax=Oreochromis niloticus TaxID=8128 RepID=UPI0009047F13|nr:testicular haploid expressed gene protein-like isoform X2 [Oreochromis niloticus]
MVSGKQAVQSTFGPSQRILELAQHKTSKTVWATTPCEKLSWGNQEPVWPISASALGAAPSARIQYLSRHKRDFSAREDHRRKEEEATASLFRKTQRPSSKTSQYENTLRLSTPRTRTRSSQDAGLSPDPPVSGIPGPSQLRGRELLVLRRKNRDFEDSLRNTIVQGLMPPHTPQCEKNCPVWHTEPRVKSAVITPRLLQLSKPKLAHPDFQRSREGCVVKVETNTFCLSAERCFHRLSLIQKSSHLAETRPAVAAQTEGEQHLLRTWTSRGIHLECFKSSEESHSERSH